MGCGISKFGRNYYSLAGDDQTTASQSRPQPQPEGVNTVNSVKATSRSRSPAPAPGLERYETERMNVNEPERKEDADDDDNSKQGHEETDDSIFRFPRSPSFRVYCTDPEIRFGIDSGRDNDDDEDDMDSYQTSRKLSKSTMSSPPSTQDKVAGLNGELAMVEAKDESKGRPWFISATGVKIRNALTNKWGRSGTQARSIRSYFQLPSWHKPA